jgi:hypothetical protein
MSQAIPERKILHNRRRENAISTITLVMSSTVMNYLYCNGFDERVARQQLCKHGPTRNNTGGCFFLVRGDVTQRWVVVMRQVFAVMRVHLSATRYISDRFRSVQGRVISR